MRIGVERLAVSARAFLLLALALPVLWERQAQTLPFLLGLAAIFVVASWHEVRTSSRAVTPWLIEAALVGALAGIGTSVSPELLAALTLPPFLSGLRHGFEGVAEALAAELVCVVGVSVPLHGYLAGLWGTAIFTWTTMALGAGLVAGYFHNQATRQEDSLAAYRAARRHLTELVNLSDGLQAGLDPAPLGRQVVARVLDDVPAQSLTVLVRSAHGFTPLAQDGSTTGPASPDLTPEPDQEFAAAVSGASRPIIDGQRFGFALTEGSRLGSVVVGTLSPGLLPEQIGLRAQLERASADVEELAVHLDTALLFAAFRDAATADERRRLAREMHDGVAQDIAGLGYLVDAITADPAAAPVADQLALVRQGITSVVAEVRRSVLTLRSGVEGNESLGAAISSVARHLSAVSGVPITVSADEGTTRLLPDVEAELMRIAQEAMNNAVKHAQASGINVRCRVEPPFAEIIVTDDGRGLQTARLDSHGLEIMRERARLIGAQLSVANRPIGGTEVAVRLPGAPTPVNALPVEKESVAS